MNKDIHELLDKHYREFVDPAFIDKTKIINKEQFQELASQVSKEEFIEFAINIKSICPVRYGLMDYGSWHKQSCVGGRSQCKDCYKELIKDFKFKDDMESEKMNKIQDNEKLIDNYFGDARKEDGVTLERTRKIASLLTKDEFMNKIKSEGIIGGCPIERLGTTTDLCTLSGAGNDCEECFEFALNHDKVMFKDDSAKTETYEGKGKALVDKEYIEEYFDRLDVDGRVSKEYTREVCKLITKEDFFNRMEPYCPNELGFEEYCGDGCGNCYTKMIKDNIIIFKDTNKNEIALETLKHIKETIEAYEFLLGNNHCAESLNNINNVIDELSKEEDKYPLTQGEIDSFLDAKGYSTMLPVKVYHDANSPYIQVELKDGTLNSSCCQEGDIWNPQVGMEVAWLKACKKSRLLQYEKKKLDIEKHYQKEISNLEIEKKSELINCKNNEDIVKTFYNSALQKYYK